MLPALKLLTLPTPRSQKYVYWDIHVEKTGSGACSGYNIKENTEAFKGRCDLSQDGNEDGVDGCCRICNAKPGCRAFTHLRKSCWLKTCSDVDPGKVLAVPGATGGWLA